GSARARQRQRRPPPARRRARRSSASDGDSWRCEANVSSRAVPELPVLDHDAVLAAVTPQAAIERVRAALLRHHAGNWVMPPKVYLECPPYGDFRAMPVRGGGLALLKWITSFPGNPERGLPTVN